ncbi:hypothetical protein BOTBODRAFT_180662 [Botryobasidium botryosum FD-172 SS1]|uniref:Uncharacterized protein n=1 Tax=Botryobasidium botryosum (strain FD-172 SS1) TaxID=930990 RepID=A0A067M7C5_BOTB1|nr:hypothetical protein BOTBODRAFT_180662 [Botryobasidium botryosum FD-172 SS1]
MGRSKNTKVNKGIDNEAALAALHAQGQDFLQSFALPAGLGKKRKHAEEVDTRSNKKGKGKEKEVVLATESDDDEGTDVDVDEEDWTDGEDVSDEEEEEQDTSDNDSLADNTPSTSTSGRQPTVVVFSQPATNTNNNPLHPKSFMSSKISKVTQSTDGRASTKTKTDEEAEEDRYTLPSAAQLHH